MRLPRAPHENPTIGKTESAIMYDLYFHMFGHPPKQAQRSAASALDTGTGLAPFQNRSGRFLKSAPLKHQSPDEAPAPLTQATTRAEC